MAISPYYRSANRFYETYRGPGSERTRERELDWVRLLIVLTAVGVIVFLVGLALLYG